MDQEAGAVAPVDHVSPERVLLERFGHTGFRPGQREVIDSVLSGRDTLAILPTGGGKSVTYQLPALVCGRCSLVISPLVALMLDQVSQARRRGLRAASVDSTLYVDQRSRVLADVREGSLELLYAASEALAHLAADLGETRAFGMFAVDEAHCISQWDATSVPTTARSHRRAPP